MRWTSFFTGVGALILLDVVLGTDAAAGRVSGLLGLVGATVEHLMSPAYPLIPDLRGNGAAQNSSTSTSGGVQLVAAGQGPPGYPTAVPNPNPVLSA